MKRYIFLFLVLLNVCTIQAQRVRVAAPKTSTGSNWGDCPAGLRKCMDRQPLHNPTSSSSTVMPVVRLPFRLPMSS